MLADPEPAKSWAAARPPRVGRVAVLWEEVAPVVNDSLTVRLRCSSGLSMDSESLIVLGSPVRAVELEDEEVRIDVVSASDEALDDSGSTVPARIGVGGWSCLAEPAVNKPGAV
jgi:hypothetical protein